MHRLEKTFGVVLVVLVVFVGVCLVPHGPRGNDIGTALQSVSDEHNLRP
jgi:hypothetical protein